MTANTDPQGDHSGKLAGAFAGAHDSRDVSPARGARKPRLYFDAAAVFGVAAVTMRIT
jgi:hypothetical protein